MKFLISNIFTILGFVSMIFGVLTNESIYNCKYLIIGVLFLTTGYYIAYEMKKDLEKEE